MCLVTGQRISSVKVLTAQNRKLCVMISGVPRIFFLWGGVSIRTVEDRENGDLGVAAP
jgi:hypothetical protein